MKILPRLYPFFLGVVMFNCIRLTTDLPKNEGFWADSMRFHLHALAITILMCYLFDWGSRYFLSKVRSRMHFPVAVEYLLVVLNLFVSINLIIYMGDKSKFLYLGNQVNDYIIANVIYIPLLFMYYILLRNNKIEEEFHRQSLLLEKIKVDQLEMELKFLRSQYHPHFLFNALNTVYFQIDEKNEAPRHTIEMLSNLLRYQLYSGNQQVSIEKEIDYLKTYMSMQRLRMSERLVLHTTFSPSLKEQKVYPLLFLPLVENAFKYAGGAYHIACNMSVEDDRIIFEMSNTVPSLFTIQTEKRGIGLDNLKRRLSLLYPDKHSFIIKEEEGLFTVRLTIKTDTR